MVFIPSLGLSLMWVCDQKLRVIAIFNYWSIVCNMLAWHSNKMSQLYYSTFKILNWLTLVFFNIVPQIDPFFYDVKSLKIKLHISSHFFDKIFFFFEQSNIRLLLMGKKSKLVTFWASLAHRKEGISFRSLKF